MRRGDRVALYLDNSVEAVAALFGVLKAGGVFFFVNPTTKADKLAYMLNNARAAAIVADDRRGRIWLDVRDATPHTRVGLIASPATGAALPAGVDTLDAAIAAETDAAAPGNDGIDVDLAALVYTSGSTGHPKGVMLTHLNIVSAATSITTYLKNTADDIILNVLPLSFDYGLYQVLMSVKMGATIVLERSFTYPHAVLERLVTERVTGFPIVPTILAILLQLDLGKYDFSRLRYVSNTGAALPVDHIARLRRLFPTVQIYSMYGLTECKRVAYLPPELIDTHPGSVGRAMPNVEVYLVDERGKRLDRGTGQLVIRGSNVMRGYWELPEETNRMLKPGENPGEMVLYSGDTFRIDDEGLLYFVGRTDEIIKTRGEKVSPREVENALYALEGIAEAAVVGVPDEVLGQAIRAVVTLRDGANLDEKRILAHCARHLEDFMVPRAVEIRTLLPKTSSGKIAKKELFA